MDKIITECFNYNSCSGVLLWKTRPRSHFRTERGWKTFNSQKAGMVAGTVNSQGYLQVAINKTIYRVHRIIFTLMGQPLCEDDFVDHINHIRTDNRFENLRVVTKQENSKNLSKRSNSKCALVGVYFNQKENLYYPSIQVERKSIKLGATKDFFEACCKRKSAEIKYGFHENHGV